MNTTKDVNQAQFILYRVQGECKPQLLLCRTKQLFNVLYLVKDFPLSFLRGQGIESGAGSAARYHPS
jgi:hypothetical protein